MTTTLILVPTAFELKILQGALDAAIDVASVRLECCGFGAIASAARAVQLAAVYDPQRIILAGIAGGISEDLQIGQACWFTEVGAYGIGAGSGNQFRTAHEMGWPHIVAADSSSKYSIGDRIQLSTPKGSPQPSEGLLLTVCSASADQHDVDLRLDKFPGAVAEDMEGFSVAVAGELCGVPVEIVRGISNTAGDRNKENWRITDALMAASELMLESLI